MRSILALVLCATAGCSLLVHDGPPTGATSERFVPCDESVGWPIVDTAIAAAMAFNAAACVTQEPCDIESEAGKTGAVIGAAAIAAVYAYSAFSGYRGASRCNDLHEEFAARPEPRVPDPGGDVRGGEGQDCRPRGGCDDDLVCASGLCVRPPEQRQ